MRDRRGFTLLEVVIAASIISLVMALVISAINVQTRVGQAARRSTEIDQLARTALDIMALDIELALAGQPGLSGATGPASGSASGAANSAGGDSANDSANDSGGSSDAAASGDGEIIRGKPIGTRLRPGYQFSVLVRALEGEPVVRVVYTTAKPEKTEDGPMIITRREQSLLGLPEGPGELVCRRVSRFGVKWLKAAAGDAPEEEADQWTSDPPPPAARLELTLLDKEGSPTLFERTMVRLSGLNWAKPKEQK